MFVHSVEEVDLIEGDLDVQGLPVYMVMDSKPAIPKVKFFQGETAYTDALRFMNDLVLPRIHGGKHE